MIVAYLIVGAIVMGVIIPLLELVATVMVMCVFAMFERVFRARAAVAPDRIADPDRQTRQDVAPSDVRTLRSHL